MSSSYLLLWLEAPLQSWGYNSRFGRRDTLGFPTRSGVLGLICCALGAGGEQRDLLARLSSGEMRVEAYTRADGDGCPTLPEPPLSDFQMVGGGYDTSDPWESLMVPKTSKGKKPSGNGAKMTYRNTLQDMAFAVTLEVPESMAGSIGEALMAPIWDVYLGRKHCAPTEIIYQGVFDTPESAHCRAKEMADSKRRASSFQVIEGEHDGQVLVLNDAPTQFGEDKRYSDRFVTIIHQQT